MGNDKKYRISWLGKFSDNSTEDEFLADNLGGSVKITAYIALVFGLILGLFLANSYFTERGTDLFLNTTPIRLVFIFTSIVVFFTSRNMTNPKHFIRVVTFYQAMMAITYLLTLEQYAALNYFSVHGLMVITLAIYLLPNRISLSQLITLIFSIVFFIRSRPKLVEVQISEFYRIIAYQTILLIYCNINYFWAEIMKRKAFAANRKLLGLSSRDALTGIYNRKKFDDAMDEWVDAAKGDGSPLSLILFDVDNFKGINDNYGHIMGDNVLKNIAAVVSQSIRDTDVFARWGGDEFVILLPNTDIQKAKAIVERIRKNLAESTHDTLRGITCSFGVAAYEKTDTKQSLLRRVDDLLLQAKAEGKNRVVI